MDEFTRFFGSTVNNLVSTLHNVYKSFEKVGEAFAAPAGAAAPGGGRGGAFPYTAPIVEAVNRVNQTLNQILGHLGGALTAQAHVPTLELATPADVAPPEEGGGGLGVAGFAAAAGAVTAGLAAAVGAVVAALEKFVAQVAGFVEALSPGTMIAFNTALKDLRATIGVAFQPIFEVLTGAFRQIAGIILPVMEQLRPVVQSLAQTYLANLIVWVKSLAAALEALNPVFQVFAVLVELVGAVFRLLYTALRPVLQAIGFLFQILQAVLSPVLVGLQVFSALLDGLGEVLDVVAVIGKTVAQMLAEFVASLFGGQDLKSAIDGIRAAVKGVIEALLLFVVGLAKLLGFNKFVDRLLDNLSPKAGATAAATSPALKSFEQLARDIATSAFAATGGGADEKKTDLADIVAAIRDGKEPLTEIGKKVEEILKWLRDRKEQVEKAFDTGKGAATGAIGPETTRGFFRGGLF